MKLTTFILIISLTQVSAASFGQSLTLKQNKLSMGKLFFEIRKQTGYDVILEDTKVLSAKQLNANFDNTPIAKVMEQVIEGTSLQFTIEDKTILIREKPKSFLDKVMDYLAAIDVTGKVTDSDGKPLPGATVTIKGTRITATTDNTGSFVLRNVDENAVLIITYVGFESAEMKATGNLGTIKLISSLSKLDEVQVIAYGTTTKRLSTGNSFTVTAKDIEKQPVQNPLLALQGRVPGLTITQNSGVSGGAVTVRIQGINSISGGKEPLYVIDGMPISSQLATTGLDAAILGSPEGSVGLERPLAAGNPLNYLNPLDIESIDVLKDADATAIYGSRAANGAILITTKKGKAGPARLDIGVQTGVGEVANRLKVLDTRQYLDMRYEAYRNDNIDWKATTVSANDLKVWDTTKYTNWQDKLFGNTARYHNVNAGISGGNENVQYRVAANYNRQTTVFPNINNFADQKISLGFHLGTVSTNKKMKMQFSGNYLVDDNKLPRIDITQRALFLEPNAPDPLNADGTLNWALNSAGVPTFTANPYISLFQYYENRTANLIGNLKLQYDILPNLTMSGNFGYNSIQTTDFSASPTTTIAPNLRASIPNSASYGERQGNSWTVEPQLQFKKSFGKLNMDVLLGSTYLVNDNKVTSFAGQTYASDEVLKNPLAAATVTIGTSTISEYKYLAAFGRINLNFENRYILNLTARRDGSSRFGSKSQFNNFGAVGASWIFTNEQYFNKAVDFISFGKLRGSFGTTGNDQIGDFLFVSRYSPQAFQVPYQGATALVPTGLPNPYLEWEETKKLQIGADLGFFKDRVLLGMTYFRNSSSNQLLTYNYSYVTGFPNITTNLPALIINDGWEFSVNFDVTRAQAVLWNSSFNISLTKNRLAEYPDLQNSGNANLLKIGEPISVTRLPHFLGVNPSTGTYQFANNGANPVATPVTYDDLTVWISNLPKFYGGWQNNIRFKGFQLDFSFQFVKQKWRGTVFGNGLNATPGVFLSGSSNQPATVLDRWQNVGDITQIEKFSSVRSNAALRAMGSDGTYLDASFIRMKNLSVSYTLPKTLIKALGNQNLTIYLQGQNLWTITNYKGLDPETLSNSTLPPLRIWTMGLKLGVN